MYDLYNYNVMVSINKEMFLRKLRLRYPQVQDEDELYKIAMHSYHLEHEYAKKTRAENKALEQNLRKHPELAGLFISLLAPYPDAESDIIYEMSNLVDTLITPYLRQIENDFEKLTGEIEKRLLDKSVCSINHSIDSTDIYGNVNYPDEFTTVECIAAQYQRGMTLDELAPDLENILLSIFEKEYDNLKNWEKLILQYSELSIEDGVLLGKPVDRIVDNVLEDFKKLIDEMDLERREREIKEFNEAKKNNAPQVDGSYMNELDFQPVIAMQPQSNELKGFAAVAGLHELKAKLQNDIIDVVRESERANALKISLPNGMLLYGPPGCGKTYFAQRLAEETNFTFKYVNCSDIASTYIHGTQEKIRKIFDEAEKNAPCIIFFDEVEAMIPQRGRMGVEYTQSEVNEFLTQMNNCGKKGIVVMGATNRPQDIDKAALRSGRMEYKYYFPLPDYEARCSLFAIHLNGVRFSGAMNLDELSRLTEGYVSADIERIITEAKREAFNKNRSYLLMSDVQKAIMSNRPSVGEAELKAMEAIRDKFENRKSERPRIGFC